MVIGTGLIMDIGTEPTGITGHGFTLPLVMSRACYSAYRLITATIGTEMDISPTGNSAITGKDGRGKNIGTGTGM
jgi:hypothetical protein